MEVFALTGVCVLGYIFKWTGTAKKKKVLTCMGWLLMVGAAIVFLVGRYVLHIF